MSKESTIQRKSNENHNSSEENTEEDEDESEKGDVFQDQLEFQRFQNGKQGEQSNRIQQEDHEPDYEVDNEIEVKKRIYQAMLQRHDLLGVKKGGDYKKYKPQSVDKINDNLMPGQHIVLNQYLQNKDQEQLQRKNQYLNYLRQKMIFSIDGKKKLKKVNQSLRIGDSEKLEVIGNTSIYPKEVINDSIQETARERLGYNRFQEALSFKKVYKSQLNRKNNPKLQEIHRILVNDEFCDKIQPLNSSQSNELAEGITQIRSAMRVQIYSQKSNKHKDEQANDKLQKTRIQKFYENENIILPILAQDKVIYSGANLNSDSIKRQNKISLKI